MAFLRQYRHLLLPCLVLLVCLGFTARAYFYERDRAQREFQASVDFNLRDIISRIEDRMAASEQMLRGVQGLFAASPKVGPEVFRAYVESLQLGADFTGVKALGVALAETGTDSVQGVSRAPITLIEPIVERNELALRYDPYSDAVRRQAMNQARDSGNATISSKVRLVMDDDEHSLPGFVMYLPLYQPGGPWDSVAERRAHIKGWVFASFRVPELMATLYGEYAQGDEVEIYDGVEVNPANLLYDADGSRAAGRESPIAASQFLVVGGRTWTVCVGGRDEMESRFRQDRSLFVGGAGSVLSLLIALLSWQMITTRRRALLMAREMTEELRESEQRWAFAVEGAGDGVWDWQMAEGTMVYSHRWKEMLGYADDEIGNDDQEWISRIHPEDLSEAQSALQRCLSGETPVYVLEQRLRCKDGRWKWMLVRGMVVSRGDDGGALRMIGTVSDINERHVTEERIRHMAQHDLLTDLPNRALFSDRVQQVLARARRNKERFAILVVDLDEFKPVNDHHGHGVGDQLLKEVARRLLLCVRESDTVGRVGGDEFVALLPSLHSEQDAVAVGEKIRHAIAEPFEVGGHRLHISSSIGIAVYPEDGRDEIQLLKRADDAMYWAKGSGRNNVQLARLLN
ncbi:MAG: GGDEF domain-containing protein [Betaproteobacteria bacterium]|nr:GGDEF domain-containing protein [Betaproteobacteria bacterium]